VAAFAGEPAEFTRTKAESSVSSLHAVSLHTPGNNDGDGLFRSASSSEEVTAPDVRSSEESGLPLQIKDCSSFPHIIIAANFRDLGYPIGNSHGEASALNYLFDYCLYTLYTLWIFYTCILVFTNSIANFIITLTVVSAIIPIMLPVHSLSGQKALRSFWSRSILGDPLVLQAAVSHSAVYLDTVHKRGPSYLAATQTRHAISLINERIADRSLAFNDEVMEAVALLASNSVSLSCRA
jgi:hypothetical protein